MLEAIEALELEDFIFISIYPPMKLTNPPDPESLIIQNTKIKKKKVR